MSVIVTDSGFRPAAEPPQWQPLGAPGPALRLAPDTDPAALPASFAGIEIIGIDFPAHADGRGFTLARLLRLRGFAGRLRAIGHVLADQYAMARRAGFDEVEIADELAARQTEDQWLARANWQAHDYQSRLRAPALRQSA